MRDFFVLDVLDVVPRSDMASMEHPLFSLSHQKPETRELAFYEHDGNRLEIIPSVRGLPTVFDKGHSDLLHFEIDALEEFRPPNWPEGAFDGRTISWWQPTGRPTISAMSGLNIRWSAWRAR